ncbi:flagellar filament capping protein FliD [Clostridium ganghwense]|uniref:Filament cap protein n=1 Tax=Clostridium ganghwense TaxID=312089 RepID=A0ABT4CMX5_9CLOT|nr:flagellar filament capping protein FliD [Clostridium ganghwense]MCY6370399.1 flagellar filament capping protein FliD [Clostridium ganghwense]
MSDTSIYSSAANRLRFTGMASGIDVDEAVKKMMKAEQIKVDKVKQQEQYLQWKQEAYREFIKEMKKFQEYFKVGSEKCITKSTFNPFSVSSVNENIATAKAVAGAVEGSYKLNVEQMAKGASVKGSSINAQFKINDGANWKGKSIDFEVTTKSTLHNKNKSEHIIDNINKQINNNPKLKGKVVAAYVSDGGKDYVKFQDLTSDKFTVKLSDGSVSTTNKGFEISKLVDEGLSVDFFDSTNTKISNISKPDDAVINKQMIDDINKQIFASPDLRGKVTASYDSGKIKFEKLTSDAVNISFKDKDGVENTGSEFGISKFLEQKINIDFSVTAKSQLDISSSIADLNSKNGEYDEIVADINKQISNMSQLKGKLTASYIQEGTEGYIKFSNLSKAEIKMAPSASNAVTGVTGVTDISAKDIINLSKSTKLEELNSSLDEKEQLHISYNGGEAYIDISKGETIDKLIKDINSKTLGKVIASFDEVTGKFSFVSKETGSDAVMSFDSTNNELLKTLGMQTSSIEGKSLNTKVEVDDINNWKGKDITFNYGGTPPNTKTFTLSDDDDLGKIVKDLNEKIGNSDLEGKISAQYVEEAGKKYIKFNDITGKGEVKITETTIDNQELKDLADNDRSIITANKATDIGSIIGGKELKLSYSYYDEAQKKIKTVDMSSISIDADEKIESLLEKINKHVDNSGKIIASFDDSTGKISIKPKEFNSDISISFEGTDTDVVSGLGLKSSASTMGQDAVVKIESPGDSEITITEKSNNFTANGVTYDVKSTGETSLTVNSDEQKVVDKVREFVDDYNKLIEKLQKKLTEKRPKVGEYKPLTDEQKKAMSKEDIEKWEAKGKQGILRNDDLLERMFTELRGAFTSSVKDSSIYFGKYGDNAVGVDMYGDYKRTGQIDIKEDALLKAIKSNSGEVEKFFFNESNSFVSSSKTYVGSEKYNEDGIFTRMKCIFQDYVGRAGLGEDGKFSLSGSMNIYANKQFDFSLSGGGRASKNTISDQIHKQNIAIQNALKKMYAKQEKYYQQFSRLETAMNNLNAQSAYLAQQLGM